MVFVDDTINTLKREYELNADQIQALNDILTTDPIEQLITTQKLNPKNFLYTKKSNNNNIDKKIVNKIISLENIKQLISISTSFDSDQLALDSLILWLEHDEQIVTTLPSQTTIDEVKNNRLDIEDWRSIFLNDPKNGIEWIKINERVRTLNNTRPSQIEARRAEANSILDMLVVDEVRNFIFHNNIFLREHFDIYRELRKHANAHYEPLEQAARRYFEALFSDDRTIKKIEFHQKPDGDQLGRKLTISYSTERNSESETQAISFFIKTHQHGCTSGNDSRRTHPVDPKELFVYRVLQHIGLGPKAHFFFNKSSAGGFFIATQDCGFTKNQGKTKLFETYASLKEKWQPPYSKALTEQTIQAFYQIEILSRVFRLSDITTNTRNFGRVMSDNIEKWKIIDFRVNTDVAYGYVDIFEGFIQGNGMQNYEGLLGQVLRESPEEKCVSVADKVIQDFTIGKAKRQGVARKMPLIKAIEEALDEIDQYICENAQALNITELADSRADLARFKDAAICNFKTLSAKVSAYQKEKSSEQLPLEQCGL